MLSDTLTGFHNIRIALLGGRPHFFLEDITGLYGLEDVDCLPAVKKHGRVVSDSMEDIVLNYDGLQALVALAHYGFGGDPKDLRRYKKLIGE